MKKQVAIIGIITLLICVGLSGCNSSTEQKSTPEEKVIGDWISKIYNKGEYTGGPDFHYTFYSNGTCLIYIIGNESRHWYRYEFLGQQLITTDPYGTGYTREYSFSDDNNQLVIIDKSYPDFTEFLERE